ncbi:MAG: multidrug efflux SMR transporter [Methanomassiliicoccales archaeon]
MPEDVPGALEVKTKDPAWTLLVVAGLLEPVWVTAMKLSEGFTDIPWAVATFVALFFSMYLLGKALKMSIPMGTAYAVWVGIGAIGALIVGILLFNEPSDLLRLFFVLLIVIGIVGVQVTSK